MIQADSVLSTPPTNTPIDTTRRRFLIMVAGASVVTVGGLAVAATPVTTTTPEVSPALRTAMHTLGEAHILLIRTQATYEEAQAIADDWEVQNPMPASERGRTRWWKKASAHREALVSKPWRELMDAETAFAAAQIAVGLVSAVSMADIQAMAACSVIYDEVELARVNRAPIARAAAFELVRLDKAVQP